MYRFSSSQQHPIFRSKMSDPPPPPPRVSACEAVSWWRLFKKWIDFCDLSWDTVHFRRHQAVSDKVRFSSSQQHPLLDQSWVPPPHVPYMPCLSLDIYCWMNHIVLQFVGRPCSALSYLMAITWIHASLGWSNNLMLVESIILGLKILSLRGKIMHIDF